MSTGKTNLACESVSNSEFSDSMARSATATHHTSEKRVKRLNFDSGTSDTLIPSWSCLDNPKPSTLVVRTADNSKIKANLSGRLPLNIPNFPPVTAHQVPGLAEPLLSVSDVTDRGTAVIFLKDSVLFTASPSKVEQLVRGLNTILAEGKQEQKSYYLYDTEPVIFQTSPSSATSLLTWHHRLSHTSLRNLQDLRRRGEIEVTTENSRDVVRCDDFMVGKFNGLNTRSRGKHKVIEALDCVHSDL